MLKFKMYMERRNKALFVDKDDWLNKIMPNSGSAICIDLEPLPIVNIKKSDGFQGSLVRPSSKADYTIEVYREDKEDDLPVNRYTWSVFENITNVSSYQNIVNASSTRDDNNLRDSLDGLVMLIPDPKDNLHWLPSIPSSVSVIIDVN